MNKGSHIVLISSSTGGHAVPIFELYQQLVKAGQDVTVVHSNSAIEKKLFSGIKSKVIRSGKINRYQKAKNFIEIPRIFWAGLCSLMFIISNRTNLIFSKGGFNSIPILFWAKLFNIPYFIHESDIVMGAANRLFYKKSVKTFVSFPVDCYQEDRKKLIYSGQIVRSFSPLKLNHTVPQILVAGGSQGSDSINKVVKQILPELLQKYRVVHSLGNLELDAKGSLAELPLGIQQRYETFGFSLDKMEESIRAADLIITRSGANMLGEIASLAKASILIPYPYAASDHQLKNARFLEKIGGAIIIKEDILSPEILLERINFVLSDLRNAQILGENAQKALNTGGKEFIVKEILKAVGAK